MALSGIFYGTTSNPRLKPQIVWSAVQNVAGNYSDVTATLQYTRSNSGYTTGGTWSGSLTINGSTKNGSGYMEITYGNTTTVLSNTVRVYHNDNGEKSITISATGGITYPAEASLKTTTISATVTLNTIARASAVSASDGAIGSCSTLVVSKKGSGFTHALAYRFGDLSGYIDPEGQAVDAPVVFSDTVVNFSLPESFYGQIPNSKTGPCTVTCITYSGKTEIGRSAATFTATAPESLCAPTASLSVTDCNENTLALTGDSSVLVLHASSALCSLSATAQKGAEITKKQVSGQGFTGDTLVVEKPVSGEFSYSAADSRGYETRGSLAVSAVPYVLPTCNATVKRESPTANAATLSLSGQCYAGSFGLADNSLTLTVAIPETGYSQQVEIPLTGDNTYSLQMELTELSYTQSYSVSVTVADKLFSVEKDLTLSRGEPVFDWGEGDFAFHVPVSFSGAAMTDFVAETGDWGVWHYRLHRSGLVELFGYTKVAVPAATQLGSIYATNRITVPYPRPLRADKPMYRYITIANQGVLSGSISGDETDALGFRLHMATQAPVSEATVMLYVVGYWEQEN